MAVHYFKQ